jgi:hypothetical protein
VGVAAQRLPAPQAASARARISIRMVFTPISLT